MSLLSPLVTGLLGAVLLLWVAALVLLVIEKVGQTLDARAAARAALEDREPVTWTELDDARLRHPAYRARARRGGGDRG